jgi:hypothetical protein
MLAIALLLVVALSWMWLWSRQEKRIAAAASKAPFTIGVHDNGLTVHRENSVTTSVRWEDILAVRAFKVDCYAYDTIYFAVDSTVESAGFQMSEDHYQFNELVSVFEARLPEFDRNWLKRVAFPPFERCETVLYLRRGVLADSEMASSGTGRE